MLASVTVTKKSETQPALWADRHQIVSAYYYKLQSGQMVPQPGGEESQGKFHVMSFELALEI